MAQANTQEELEKAIAEGTAQIVPVDAPLLYASTLSIGHTSNEFTLTFSRAAQIMVRQGNEALQATTNQPVAVISVSPQTAKDALLLLGDIVTAYEKAWGNIATEYTLRRDAEKASNG